jgi:hypothetical protein
VKQLITMRLIALTRTGQAIAPLLTGLVIFGLMYGGGAARPAEAYGVSALVLFPLLAWETKILLDTDPDTQRKLVVVALGSRRRETIAGVIAAAITTVPVILLAIGVPWLLGAVTLADGGPGLVSALLLGLWAHVIAVIPALALGAMSSRVITGSPGIGVAVLASGAVLAIVLGIPGSPVPWLAPPLIGVARALTGREVAAELLLPYTLWAALWAIVMFSVYGWLRRTRA